MEKNQTVHGKNGMFKEKKFWNNKKILITGHTGFKGSWLSLMLYILELSCMVTH